MGLRRASQIVAWLATAYIVFVTLSPVSYRPQLGHPNLERLGAYLFVGTAFSVGYPKARRLVAIALVLGACLLEAGQLLVPGRDARLSDAGVKALGGILGMLLAVTGEYLLLKAIGQAIADQRKSERAACSIPAYLFDEQGVASRATILDRSAGGVRVLCEEDGRHDKARYVLRLDTGAAFQVRNVWRVGTLAGYEFKARMGLSSRHDVVAIKAMQIAWAEHQATLKSPC